jgi:hypothetical protein
LRRPRTIPQELVKTIAQRRARSGVLVDVGSSHPSLLKPGIPCQTEALSTPSPTAVEILRKPSPIEFWVHAIVVFIEVALRHPSRLRHVEDASLNHPPLNRTMAQWRAMDKNNK